MSGYGGGGESERTCGREEHDQNTFKFKIAFNNKNKI